MASKDVTTKQSWHSWIPRSAGRILGIAAVVAASLLFVSFLADSENASSEALLAILKQPLAEVKLWQLLVGIAVVQLIIRD